MRMARGRKVTLGVGASGDGEGTIAPDEPQDHVGPQPPLRRAAR